jgi:hypothetical protein
VRLRLNQRYEIPISLSPFTLVQRQGNFLDEEECYGGVRKYKTLASGHGTCQRRPAP